MIREEKAVRLLVPVPARVRLLVKGFSEEKHRREPKGATSRKYKPGEFVPQQEAAAMEQVDLGGFAREYEPVTPEESRQSDGRYRVVRSNLRFGAELHHVSPEQLKPGDVHVKPKSGPEPAKAKTTAQPAPFVPPGVARGRTLIPVHEVQDPAHAERLAEAMERSGWQGAPLVKLGAQLITGAHRYAAAKRAGVKIPTVDLWQLFAGEGKSLRQIWQEEANPRLSWQTNLTDVLNQLSESTLRHYGIDWDGMAFYHDEDEGS